MNSDHVSTSNNDDRHAHSTGRDPRETGAILNVYATGEVTVVGFGNKDVPDELCVAHYREQLLDLIQQCGCKTLAIDLSGVRFMPSGMLGLMSSLRKKVDRLEVYNPSSDVLGVLKLTRLDQLLDVRTIELPIRE